MNIHKVMWVSDVFQLLKVTMTVRKRIQVGGPLVNQQGNVSTTEN